MHKFRVAVEAGDIEAAVGLLADDVTFHSPVVFAPYEGRDAVALILRTVITVFEDFHYVDELSSSTQPTHALVFRTRIGDRAIEGADFIRENDRGEITELTVMVRPMSGAVALAEAMKARLTA